MTEAKNTIELRSVDAGDGLPPSRAELQYWQKGGV